MRWPGSSQACRLAFSPGALPLGAPDLADLKGLGLRLLVFSVGVFLLLLALRLVASLVQVAVSRRALARRVEVLLVPTDTFAPDPAAVSAAEHVLADAARKRVRGWWSRPASALSVRLLASDDGYLEHRAGGPHFAAGVLGQPRFGEVEVRPIEEQGGGAE